MSPTPVYTAYKPLRNLLRQYNLRQSLEDVWMLSDHLSSKKPLPLGFGDGQPHRVKDYLFPWCSQKVFGSDSGIEESSRAMGVRQLSQ